MFHFKKQTNKQNKIKQQQQQKKTHTFPSLNREGARKEHAIVFPESRSVT